MANQQANLPIDLYIAGQFSCKTAVLPAGCVLDAQVATYSGPGNAISAAKFQQQHQKEYGQPAANSAITEQKVIHVVRGQTYALLEFMVWAATAATGNDTCVFNLLRNGVGVLTATLTLDSTTAAYTLKNSAGFSNFTPAQADIFEVSVTANHVTGTLAKGIGAKLVLREDPQ